MNRAMSPAPLHPKSEETTAAAATSKGQSHLKINRESHSIKKSSSTLSNNKTQQRQPVIIYTHSPRVIHTDPSNFMALVQKLTGLSSSQHQQQQQREESGGGPAGGCKLLQPKQETAVPVADEVVVVEYPKNVMAAYCKEEDEDETTSSLIMKDHQENNSNMMSMVDAQCLGPLVDHHHHQDPMMIPNSNNNNNNYVMRRTMAAPVFGSPEFLCSSNNALLTFAASDPFLF